MAKIRKSARTGRIVGAAEAEAHPDETFEQTIPDPVKAEKPAAPVYRDVRTGEVVDAEFAGQNPGRVFTE